MFINNLLLNRKQFRLNNNTNNGNGIIKYGKSLYNDTVTFTSYRNRKNMNIKNIVCNTNCSYSNDDKKIIQTVVNALSKVDFESIITCLERYGYCGDEINSIGFNYDKQGVIFSASVVSRNPETFETSSTTISLKDFLNILKLLEENSTKKNGFKKEVYKQIYKKIAENISCSNESLE